MCVCGVWGGGVGGVCGGGDVKLIKNAIYLFNYESVRVGGIIS